MFSKGTRRLLFWITMFSLLGSYAMVRSATCADMDVRVYVGFFALAPLASLVDAIASIVRRKARDFQYLGSAPTSTGRSDLYEVSELTGADAVALGKTRLILPAIALVAYVLALAVSDVGNLPPCS